MAKDVVYLNLKEILLQKIRENGGWVNAHAHIDRAYTVTPEKFEMANKLRHEKWVLNTDIRKSSTVSEIYDRMCKATELLLSQGTSVIGTFIDVDQYIKDKSIQAAQKVREKYKGQVVFRFTNQGSYGILDKQPREWFNVAAEFVDMIGGTLKADEGRESECLDVVMQKAKEKNKIVHMHVDELNLPDEHETELLANKTIEYGMQGKVVGIHGISINARPKEERERIYKLMKEAGLMIVACPMSWINARRSEVLAPIHNPVTPADEMIPRGIPVAIGIDNLYDIFMPFNDGNLWNDLRLLMECNRLYDLDELVKIATVNGRKALGLE